MMIKKGDYEYKTSMFILVMSYLSNLAEWGGLGFMKFNRDEP